MLNFNLVKILRADSRGVVDHCTAALVVDHRRTLLIFQRSLRKLLDSLDAAIACHPRFGLDLQAKFGVLLMPADTLTCAKQKTENETKNEKQIVL